MDPTAFDRLTRLLVTAPSRRGVLGAIIGAVPALLGRAVTEARPRPRRRFSAQGPCGDGTVRHNTCTRHDQCCTGYCHKRTNRCRCRRRGQTCRGRRNCCSRRGQQLTCRDGRCRPPLPCGGCPPGEVCAPGVGTCCPAADVCTVDGVPGACCAGRGTCCGGACCEDGCCVDGTTCVAAGAMCDEDAFCCAEGQCAECCVTANCPEPACQECDGGDCLAANEDGPCGECHVCQGGACEALDGDEPCGECQVCRNGDCVTVANGTSCGQCQGCQNGQCVAADNCATPAVGASCGPAGSSCFWTRDGNGVCRCGTITCQSCPTPGEDCDYGGGMTGLCIACPRCPDGSSCFLACPEP